MEGAGEFNKEEFQEFLEEISEQLGIAETSLMNWMQGDWSAESAAQIFRVFHNIKGISGMFGLSMVREIFHVGESLLGITRDRGICPPQDATEALLGVVDSFKRISQHVLKHGTEPDIKPYRVLAVIQETIERLSNANADKTQVEHKEDESKTSGAEKGAPAKREGYVRLSPRSVDELVEIVSDFIHVQTKVGATLDTGSNLHAAIRNDMERFSSRLQSFLLSIRMAPIGPLMLGLQRIATDTAKKLGKGVRFQILGVDTQLDKSMIEALRDPLVHIVRNAVDHGIESSDDRRQVNKVPDGQLVIEAYQRAGQIIISVRDDGRGIDAERVKTKALEKGLVAQEDLENLPESEIVNLITRSGFSTVDEVTDVSGRGVGMDVVKSMVEELGGTLDVNSEVGKGTSITLILPLTMAIIKSLAVHVGNQLYAIQQTAVEEVISKKMVLRKNMLGKVADGKTFVLHFRNQVVPVISIHQLVAQKMDIARDWVFIIIRHRGEKFCLVADAIHGPRDFVAQALPDSYKDVDVISGVSQTNTGEYISLLDLNKVAKMIVRSTIEKSMGNLTRVEQNILGVSDLFRSQQRLLFFEAGRDLTIPVQSVNKVFEVKHADVEQIGDKYFITHEGKPYPVIRVQKFLAGKELAPQSAYTAILVQHESDNAVILAEKFHGIHRLPERFDSNIKMPGALGVVTHTNRPYLVINAGKLFQLEDPDRFKEPMKNSENFRVLIVEDDNFFATNLAHYIRSLGMSVEIARDGLEAKEMLQASLNNESNVTHSFDYAIVDFEMPRMDGLQLLRWIRNHERFHNLPVSMCTAVGTELTKREAIKLGVDCFSGKMNYDKLLSYIEKRQKGARIGIATQQQEAPRPVVADDSESDRVLTFKVGTMLYALRINNLKETSMSYVSTSIPTSKKAISSVIGFRGKPIPVLDLRQFAEKSSAYHPCHQIVGDFGGKLCALWVDSVLSVKRLEEMDSSSGVYKDEANESIKNFVSDVLWHDGKSISLLSDTSIAKFIRQNYNKAEEGPVAAAS